MVVEDPGELLQFCGVREIEGELVLGSDDPTADGGGLAVLARLEVISGLRLRQIEEPVALPSLAAVDFLWLEQPESVAPPLLPKLRTAVTISVGPHAGPVDLSRLESARELSIGGEMTLEALTELETFNVGSVASLPVAPQLERISGAVELEFAEVTDLALLRNVRSPWQAWNSWP